jgi:hypothetical protein
VKVTFKKQPRETGLAAVGNPYPDVDIKVDKKVCGHISAPNWQRNTWDVYFMVIKKDILEDGNLNCEWKTVSAKKKFSTEEDARAAALGLIENILKKGYQLHFQID